MRVFVRKPDYLRNPHRYRENMAALTATLQILDADPLTLKFSTHCSDLRALV